MTGPTAPPLRVENSRSGPGEAAAAAFLGAGDEPTAPAMVIIDLPLVVIDVRGTPNDSQQLRTQGQLEPGRSLGAAQSPAVLGEVRQAFRSYATGDGDCYLL